MDSKIAVLTVAFAVTAAITCLGEAAAEPAARPPGGPARIGYLEAYATPAGWFEAFRRGLRERGYAGDRTITIEHRSARGEAARLPGLAAELVGLGVHVIVASTPASALAAKNATASIPIVMTNTNDPVGMGLIESLARPGGNVTGLATLSPELSIKRLELLVGIVPGLARFGVVGTIRTRPARSNFRQLKAAAAALRRPIEVFEARRAEEFDAAFKAAAARVGGVAVLNNFVVRTHRDIVVAAAARHRVPAIYFDAEIVLAGGLMSYGTNIPDLHRRAAIYVDKILKGARPADLPVERPTRFTMAVNLKTARALGITIPPSILLRADRLIE